MSLRRTEVGAEPENGSVAWAGSLSRQFRNSLLAYTIVLVGVITLAPFEFSIPSHFSFRWHSSVLNLITNIVLFLPIGFLHRLSFREREDRFLLRSLAMSFSISAGIELVQLFVDGRISSGMDLLANSLGGWLGAAVFSGLWRSLERSKTDQIPYLELPLINLVYLMVPLLWLNGLTHTNDFRSLVLFILLCCYGLGINLSIYIHRLRNQPSVTAARFSLLCVAWLLISSIPALQNAPGRVFAVLALMSVLVWCLAAANTRQPFQDRRFEIPTLKALLPFYLGYMVLVTAESSLIPFSEWTTLIDNFGERIRLTFRLVEVVVAFTLLGYMLSEMQGRSEVSTRRSLAAVLLASGAVLGAGILVRMQGSLHIPGPVELILFCTGTLSGALIYRQQLVSFRKG